MMRVAGLPGNQLNGAEVAGGLKKLVRGRWIIRGHGRRKFPVLPNHPPARHLESFFAALRPASATSDCLGSTFPGLKDSNNNPFYAFRLRRRDESAEGPARPFWHQEWPPTSESVSGLSRSTVTPESGATDSRRS